MDAVWFFSFEGVEPQSALENENDQNDLGSAHRNLPDISSSYTYTFNCACGWRGIFFQIKREHKALPYVRFSSIVTEINSWQVERGGPKLHLSS